MASPPNGSSGRKLLRTSRDTEEIGIQVERRKKRVNLRFGSIPKANQDGIAKTATKSVLSLTKRTLSKAPGTLRLKKVPVVTEPVAAIDISENQESNVVVLPVPEASQPQSVPVVTDKQPPNVEQSSTPKSITTLPSDKVEEQQKVDGKQPQVHQDTTITTKGAEPKRPVTKKNYFELDLNLDIEDARLSAVKKNKKEDLRKEEVLVARVKELEDEANVKRLARKNEAKSLLPGGESAIENKKATVDKPKRKQIKEKKPKGFDTDSVTGSSNKLKKGKSVRRLGVGQNRKKFDINNMDRMLASGVRRRKVVKEKKQPEFIPKVIEVPEAISVGDLAHRMSVKPIRVSVKLMEMGVVASIGLMLDQDTAQLLVEELGHTVKRVYEDALEKEHLATLENVTGEKVPRAPVVTVMGHVNHGKTSLLDYIRKSNTVSNESGGITQHIGAYWVKTKYGEITFLDTPGHEAFTAMRARGAQLTDIVILVVAADDGVRQQTEEAIKHAKTAGVSIIIAINKIDKEGADLEKVYKELAEHDVMIEAWGGDIPSVPVSTHTGKGMDELLELINLQAELLELTAVPTASGRGFVIESCLDSQRGPVITLLITDGTLRRGNHVAIGEYWGKIRAMNDEAGNRIDAAGPSVPVEVLGVNGVPESGDHCATVENEKKARDLVSARIERAKKKRFAGKGLRIEDIFSQARDNKSQTNFNIVLKTDVRGSLEAIKKSIFEFKNDDLKIEIVHEGVGSISESDASFALTSKAIILGFKVRADSRAKTLIERENIDLRYYNVIFELIEDLRVQLSTLIAPEIREEILGTALVREVFRSPRFGQIAGCIVQEGTIFRNRLVRVIRDEIVIFQGELESLRRFKEDVAEVRNGMECGIGVRNYKDVRAGDKVEVYESKEIPRTL